MNANEPAKKIVFFGDSIMFGELISPYSNWVNNVLAYIDSMESSKPLIGINSSINGNTTRMALLRIANDLQQYNPEIVMVQFGLNDANFWMTDNGLPRVSLASFRANLIEILDRSFAFGAHHVFLNTNHLPRINGPCEDKISDKAKISFYDHVILYNDEIRSIANSKEKENVSLIDVERMFKRKVEKTNGTEDFMLEDGIHLSKKGHDLYAQTVIDPLVERLNEIMNMSFKES